MFTHKNTHTVSEVKVIHIPPKPLKVRAMKIRTDRSRKDRYLLLYVLLNKMFY